MDAVSTSRLQASYELVAPRMGRVTGRFFDELFSMRPETRALFTGDMAEQRRHMAAALALIVRNVAILDVLEQPLRELGAAHARVGVRPEYYPVVCDAMVRALAAELGEGWTAEVAGDWKDLLETVARHMLAGSAPRVLA
jgi:hemoglobin-like flavoprotein